MIKSILIMFIFLGISLSDSCGGNCPSGKCPNCYCGTSQNILDISQWCKKYNWSQGCCRCIVAHESGGNSNAISYNINGSNNVGIWQINSIYWSSCSDGKPPCDPNMNLVCAIRVYQLGGNSWNLWQSHAGCGC